MSLPVSLAAALVSISVGTQPPASFDPAEAVARAVDWVVRQDAVPLGLVGEEWVVALTAEEELALSDPPSDPAALPVLLPQGLWTSAADLLLDLQREAARLMGRLAAQSRPPQPGELADITADELLALAE